MSITSDCTKTVNDATEAFRKYGSKAVDFVVPQDFDIDDVNDFFISQKRKVQDQQAFDSLYEAVQEIAAINKRALHNGQKGYKTGHEKIKEILEGIK